jgi:hypothetical protein
MYLALRKTNGDTLAASWFSILTRYRLLTKFPHAGIVIEGRLYHSTLQYGLHNVPFTNPGNWHLIEAPDWNDARGIYRRRRGVKYDWFSLLGFVVPWQVRDSSRLYCFEWCWLAMTGENPRFRVTPEMLLLEAIRMKKGDI